MTDEEDTKDMQTVKEKISGFQLRHPCSSNSPCQYRGCILCIASAAENRQLASGLGISSL